MPTLSNELDNMVQTEYYCEDCKAKHFGNCPKIKVTITMTEPVNNQWLDEIISNIRGDD